MHPKLSVRDKIYTLNRLADENNKDQAQRLRSYINMVHLLGSYPESYINQKYYANAAYNAGLTLYGGFEGQAPDRAKAFKYYKLSADQKENYGFFNLAECYRKGIGISKNKKTALKYYKLVAENTTDTSIAKDAQEEIDKLNLLSAS